MSNDPVFTLPLVQILGKNIATKEGLEAELNRVIGELVAEIATKLDSGIEIEAGDGLDGGGPLTGNVELKVDGSVIRSSGDQNIEGRIEITAPGSTTIPLLNLIATTNPGNGTALLKGFLASSSAERFFIEFRGAGGEIRWQVSADGVLRAGTVPIDRVDGDLPWSRLTQIPSAGTFSNDITVNGILIGLGGSDTTSLAVGSNAQTKGFGVTAIGQDALRNNDGGNRNTALGFEAMRTNVQGERNTAIGAESLRIGTGSDNTMVGAGAGVNLSTGSKNTYIGRFTGIGSGLDLSTSNNEIILSDGDGNVRFRIDSNGNVRWTGILVAGEVPFSRLSGVPATLSGTVNTSGNQTIGGIKTFSSLIQGRIAALHVPDTRYANDQPQDKLSYRITADFKRNSSVGNPPVTAHGTYSHIITVAGWTSNTATGGWPTQLSVGANGIAYRQANSATTWGGWNATVNTSGNQTIGGIKTFSNDIIAQGKVGIGTVSPSERLEVFGNIAASGNINAGVNLNATNNIWAGGNITGGGSITGNGAVNVGSIRSSPANTGVTTNQNTRTVIASSASTASGAASAVVASENSTASAVVASAVVASENSTASTRASAVLASIDSELAEGVLTSAIIASSQSTATNAAALTSLISTFNCRADQLASRGSVIASASSSIGGFGNSPVVIASSATRNTSSFSVALGTGSGAASTSNRKIQLFGLNGNIQITGSVSTSSFSDFAEFMPNATGEEIPAGTLLALDEGAVRPAEEGEEICGVVSHTAALLAGDSPFCWQGRYLRDEFGRHIYEEIPDPDWVPSHKQTEDDRPIRSMLKENPAWNPELPQVPRSERPDEWTPVGMLGQVYVRIGEDVKAGQRVCAKKGLGYKSNERTGVKVLEVTKPYDGEFGIARCLLNVMV